MRTFLSQGAFTYLSAALTPVNSFSTVLLTPAINFRLFGYFWPAPPPPCGCPASCRRTCADTITREANSVEGEATTIREEARQDRRRLPAQGREQGRAPRRPTRPLGPLVKVHRERVQHENPVKNRKFYQKSTKNTKKVNRLKNEKLKMRKYKRTVKVISKKSCKYFFFKYAVISFLMQIYPPYRGKT